MGRMTGSGHFGLNTPAMGKPWLPWNPTAGKRSEKTFEKRKGFHGKTEERRHAPCSRMLFRGKTNPLSPKTARKKKERPGKKNPSRREQSK
jgi:hypothetical protein